MHGHGEYFLVREPGESQRAHLGGEVGIRKEREVAAASAVLDEALEVQGARVANDVETHHAGAGFELGAREPSQVVERHRRRTVHVVSGARALNTKLHAVLNHRTANSPLTDNRRGT